MRDQRLPAGRDQRRAVHSHRHHGIGPGRRGICGRAIGPGLKAQGLKRRVVSQARLKLGEALPEKRRRAEREAERTRKY